MVQKTSPEGVGVKAAAVVSLAGLVCDESFMAESLSSTLLWGWHRLPSLRTP